VASWPRIRRPISGAVIRTEIESKLGFSIEPELFSNMLFAAVLGGDKVPCDARRAQVHVSSSKQITSVYERDGMVVLYINGYYSIADAERTAPEAGRLFAKLRRCAFVPDLRHMTGFDTSARVVWQEHLTEFKRVVHTVIMIGGSPLAKMSGGAVCLYAGIKMRFVDSPEEIFGEAQRAAGR
jgi:hypothetical protein